MAERFLSLRQPTMYPPPLFTIAATPSLTLVCLGRRSGLKGCPVCAVVFASEKRWNSG